MSSLIKVYIQGRLGLEVKDMLPEEAEKLIKENYGDPLGGLVYNKRNGNVISKITPDIEEILIINHIMGGG